MFSLFNFQPWEEISWLLLLVLKLCHTYFALLSVSSQFYLGALKLFFGPLDYVEKPHLVMNKLFWKNKIKSNSYEAALENQLP